MFAWNEYIEKRKSELKAARMSDKTYTAEELAQQQKLRPMALVYLGERDGEDNQRAVPRVRHFELRFVKPEPIEKPEEKDQT